MAADHNFDERVDAEFFFDPVCPWAWITSRWMTEVIAARRIRVNWNFISLRMLNENKKLDPEYAARATPSHVRGLRLLRVVAAVRANQGPEHIHALYTAFGTIIHPNKQGESLDSLATIQAVLTNLGLDPAQANDADNEFWDADVRASTDLALSRAGKDVGTPIITYGPPTGPSLFGPVLSVAPKGEAAGELWDHVSFIAKNPDFAELKRSLRSGPRFE